MDISSFQPLAQRIVYCTEDSSLDMGDGQDLEPSVAFISLTCNDQTMLASIKAYS